MSQRPENMISPLVPRSRTALISSIGAAALLLVGCSSNLQVQGPAPYDSDPATGSNVNYALFDPSASVIPLPNILATATVTGVSYAPPADPANMTALEKSKVYVFPGVPPTSYVNGVPQPSPKDSLAFLNLTEMGGKNAVSGLTSPIKLSFQAPVLQSSVILVATPATPTTPAIPATVKVFQVIPDVTGPTAGLTEVAPLGFRDVSALFSVEWQFTWHDRDTATPTPNVVPKTVSLANPAGVAGAAFQLVPRLPLTPGSRYVYVVTDGVKDLAPPNLPVGQSLTFGFLKYVKGADVNPNATSAGTNLADSADLQNPARIAGAASQASLQSIYGNAMITIPVLGSVVALSGYGKTMDDLIASATADTSGKAAAGAGATGIGTASENLAQRRNHIKLLGRFITTGTVATQFLANNATTQIPVEGALWAWANNAPGTPFAGAPARQWSNVVSGWEVKGSSTIPSPGQGSIDYLFAAMGLPSAIPRVDIGLAAKGSFESGDLNIDPAVAHAIAATIPPSGNLTGTPDLGSHPVYNPGYYPTAAAPVPGTGVLQGVRPDANTLTGFLHVNRTVHFWFIAPAAAPPVGGYPVLIYQHGITSQKEDIFTAANTICKAGYAILAIDAPLHGENANRPDSAEWGANFMSLLDIPNTRTNIQQGAFNLWRLEKVAKSSSLQGTAAAYGKPIATAGATKFVGLSLGGIIGAYFMAGNSNQYGLGGSNIQGLFSSPGAKTAYIIRDGKAGFEYQVNDTLRKVGVAPGSHDYDQFLLLVQTIMDSVDPAWDVSPIKSLPSGLPAPSRFSGRVCMQEAIGDTTILNTYGNALGNFLGGWGVLGSSLYDIAPNFTQVMLAGATSPVLPFMYGVVDGVPGLKTPSAPATSPSSGPTEGFFQFGTTAPTGAASHTMLLDFINPAITAAAQKQLYIWLATGRLADPADTAHWGLAGPAGPAEPVLEPQKIPFLDALR